MLKCVENRRYGLTKSVIPSCDFEHWFYILIFDLDVARFFFHDWRKYCKSYCRRKAWLHGYTYYAFFLRQKSFKPIYFDPNYTYWIDSYCVKDRLRYRHENLDRNYMVIYLVDYTFPNEGKFAHFMRRRTVVVAVTLRAHSAPASNISMNGNLIFVINRNNEINYSIQEVVIIVFKITSLTISRNKDLFRWFVLNMFRWQTDRWYKTRFKIDNSIKFNYC